MRVGINGMGRMGRLALRAALGSSRARLVRQLLVENLVLSTTGAMLGLAAGWGLLAGLIALAPPDTPRLAEIGLDGGAVLFAIGAALLSGLFFGLLPAWSTSSVHGKDVLVRSMRAGTSSATTRIRRVLIAIEVALALELPARSVTTFVWLSPTPSVVICVSSHAPAANPEPAPSEHVQSTVTSACPLAVSVSW